MFNGILRRVVSLWFPRLASDRVLRRRQVDAPFALTLKENNREALYCVNDAAARQGVYRGMSYTDARAFCADLITQPAAPHQDQQFLQILRRWATRYCPWVGLEGRDGLVLDVTGSTHLMGGEAALVTDIRQRLTRAGLSVQIGVADTRGAAWALAHHGQGIAPPGNPQSMLRDLPVAALRLEAKVIEALQRLGLRRIGDLERAARAPLARRFGPGLMLRLDQALGRQPEEITPLREPPHYAVRMTLPDPIGLEADVMAVLARLLDPLCTKLERQGMGARVLALTLRRVDQAKQEVELRLARPLRDPTRILPLFQRAIKDVDAGYGIDQIRLMAVTVEPLAYAQTSSQSPRRILTEDARIADLISRIGTRIGLENIQRFLPADSHIPERSFLIAPAAYSEPASGWASHNARPILLFPPEPITATGSRPPQRFRWRRMDLCTGRAIGPERITPEWWLDDENWRSGLRDYWRVDTQEGRRLWLFYTPQNPGWFVQGEFA